LTRSNRSRLVLFGVLALALSVTAGLTAGGVAAKKKKPKAGGIVDITKAVNAPIPDGTTTTNGLLASTIDVGGKKLRGTRIRDVNVTVQTTGSTAAGGGSASQLTARVTAPNGATVWLTPGGLSGQSIGPLTLDEESANNLGGLPPAPSPTTLVSPYAGTAQPFCWPSRGGCLFSAMDDGPVTGTWTLRFYDTNPSGPSTSVLNFWRLNVLAGKAYKTK
jgi:hypothetical protein